MSKRILLCFLFSVYSSFLVSQTTDLSVSVEAQNLEGSDVAQVHIFQEFQYIVTISNSGIGVMNATFSIDLSDTVTVGSFQSQNNIGGASEAVSLNLGAQNILTGSVPNLPSNSSVEIQIVVTAPETLGGIAIHATVTPPDGTTDVNPGNNQSIISMDVVDLPIDFTVTHWQTSPPEGTGISAWGEVVTYQFTITNNSSIAYPLNWFSGRMNLLSSVNSGQAIVVLESLECLGADGGMTCPDVSDVSGSAIVSSSQSVFTFGSPIVFTAGGSLTFEVQYQFAGATCALNVQPMKVGSLIRLNLDHGNESSNDSNIVETDLLEAEPCDGTDVCIDTVQINPDPTEVVDWEEEVTLLTTVCNNGPLDATVEFFLQNLTVALIDWNIISLTCTETTGTAICTDFELSITDMFWTTDAFTLPANSTITIETVVSFEGPECASTPGNVLATLKSVINIMQTGLIDTNPDNNYQSDNVILPLLPDCPTADIHISKNQTIPELPAGSNEDNTVNWGEITYEITAYNDTDVDVPIGVVDYITVVPGVEVAGSLVSVSCIETTGTASCFPLEHTNLGQVFDGVAENGQNDVLWEILEEDNWILPAQSSVTFQVVVDWHPSCSDSPVYVRNHATIDFFSDLVVDNNENNNITSVTTYLAPCVDLLVQTFPQFPQVNINQGFNWIVDVSNSSASYNAVNIDFENVLGDEFVVNGTPTCTVTNGNAECLTNMNWSGNTLIGTIPSMDANSTLRVSIPVLAPNFGGAFTNTVSAIPNPDENEETSPETNISISNVQVIAPFLLKTFDPETIYEGQQTTLTFTVNNISTNIQQSNISFIDELPVGLVLNGVPYWVLDNGANGTFEGGIGDAYVGVSNLNIPEGVSSCTFAVEVTGAEAGYFINDYTHFTDMVNIDATQAYATLLVQADDTDVDVAVSKSVSPTESSLGDQVVFTIEITNYGTSEGNDIEITEALPDSFILESYETSLGTFDEATLTWQVPSLAPQQTETLTLTTTIATTSNLTNVALLSGLLETDRDETNNEDEATVSINNCLKVPQVFTPNNDAFNEYFTIPCIQDYGSNHLQIVNRYGTTVFETDNYNNLWNGKPNQGWLHNSEALLPVGTYYYVLKIEALDKPMVGWIYLTY